MQNRKLFYKRDPEEEHHRGVFNFNTVRCDLKLLGKDGEYYRMDLCMKGVERIFRFRTSNHSDYSKWAEMIQKHINGSLGQKNNIGIDEK